MQKAKMDTEMKGGRHDLPGVLDQSRKKKTMITTTLNKIRNHGPCEGSWKKLLTHLGKTKADDEPLPLVTILDLLGLGDALWCCRTVPEHDKEWRLFALWCAQQVRHLAAAEDAALAAADRAAGVAAEMAARIASWAIAWDAGGELVWTSARAAVWVDTRKAA